MQHVVITGGAGGLGQALAAEFAGIGWPCEAPGRREVDVTEAACVQEFFQSRQVDLLVCAAGATGDGPLARLEESQWDALLDVNFHGAARCAAAVIPGMTARGAGHVVFISSQSALHPPPGQAAYATAKAALLGLARSLAARHGPSNIRVNAILPGFLETPMTAAVSTARQAAVLTEHALGRFNTPESVARFIRRLHQDLPHTSGQIFQLDSRSG